MYLGYGWEKMAKSWGESSPAQESKTCMSYRGRKNPLSALETEYSNLGAIPEHQQLPPPPLSRLFGAVSKVWLCIKISATNTGTEGTRLELSQKAPILTRCKLGLIGEI